MTTSWKAASCSSSRRARATSTSDNAVNFADLSSLLADWGTCDDCRGDIDGDGDVDFDDLQAFLASWGPCIN